MMDSESHIPGIVPVHGVLNKHSPYIGYFFYSTISKNIASFFAGDVTTMDEIELRRRVRFHPYTGCFHFAPGQYSDLHGLQPYRKDIQKMELSPEAQSLYENSYKVTLMLETDLASPPTNESHSNHASPVARGHEVLSRSSSKDAGYVARSKSSESLRTTIVNRSNSKDGVISRSNSRDKSIHFKAVSNNQKLMNGKGINSPTREVNDGEIRSFSPDVHAYSSTEDYVEESRAVTLLELKKKLEKKERKRNKKFLNRRDSEPIPESPSRSKIYDHKRKSRQTTMLTGLSTQNNSISRSDNVTSIVVQSPSRAVYTYGTHEHDINMSSVKSKDQRPRGGSIDSSPPPPSKPRSGSVDSTSISDERDAKIHSDGAINLSCSMGSWQIHNRLGTNGFINNNIKNKVYDHSVKTYDHVTQGQTSFHYKEGETAMSRLRELTLSGEEVHVPSSTQSVHSCQPRLVDDYKLHLTSMLGEGAYARVFLATCLKTQRPVAVKVVDKGKLNRTQESCVRRELSNQARLWHHNIVPLQAIYESKKYIYIVLEYCAAGTLEDMLSLRRKLTEEESRYIAYQLITALHYVHANGILHGDITPANIMFQPASLLSSSSGGLNVCADEIPRVDLLYEKKRREGNISFTLLQAPVVNYQKRSRDGESERSGGKDAGRRSDSRDIGPDAGTENANVDKDLEEDLSLARMREYLVRTDDIQLVNTEQNDAIPALRRDISGGSVISEKDRKSKKLGGGIDFADAAIRNSQRGKSAKKVKRSGSFTFATTEKESSSLDMSDDTHPRCEDREESHCSTNSTMSDPSNFSNTTGNGSAESWWEHQYIRYKCPYGMLLRVGDFGLCQKIPDVRHFQYTRDVNRAPYTPGGTEGYLPPEVIQKRPYGQSADMWAVGTVLFRCISGNHPFVPNESCLNKQLNYQGFVWKKVSSACVNFIRSLLAKDEADRPSAQELLGHQWFAEYTLISNAMLPECAN